MGKPEINIDYNAYVGQRVVNVHRYRVDTGRDLVPGPRSRGALVAFDEGCNPILWVVWDDDPGTRYCHPPQDLALERLYPGSRWG